MRYGHFDDERREYVITRPDTPLPWINYLGSEDYFALLSNTAGGLLVLPRRAAAAADPLPLQQRPARRGRPLPVRPRRRHRRLLEPGLAADPARARRLRVPPRPRLHASSPARAAGSAPRRSTSCRPGETLEVWRVPGDERAAASRPALSLFGAVEFCLWDAQDDATNFQRNLLDRRGPRRGRRHLPPDRVPRAPRPLRLVRLLARRSPASTRRASAFLGAVPGLGPAARRGARRAERARSPTAGSRSGRSRRPWSSAPGESPRRDLRPGLHGEPGGRASSTRPAPAGRTRPAPARSSSRYRLDGQVDARPGAPCATTWEDAPRRRSR